MIRTRVLMALAGTGLWLLATGCAPTTIGSLRENPANRVTLTVEKPFRDVYRQLKERAVDTYAVGAAYVGAELYEDLRRGDIHLVFDTIHQGYIQVSPLGDNLTQVTVAYAPESSRSLAGEVQAWLRDDYRAPRTMRPVLGIGIGAEGDIH